MRPAEVILRRGRIYLLDDQDRAVENLALSYGRVIAAGDDAEVAGAVGPSAEIVDLAGRTVLPGLIDAHLHLERYVLNLDAVDAETATLEACLARVDHRAAAAPPRPHPSAAPSSCRRLPSPSPRPPRP